MTAKPTTRTQADEMLIEKASRDDSFRRELVSDPKATIASTLGVQLPEGVKVTVLEETDRNLYLILPAKATRASDGVLADRELDAVVGGGASKAADSGKIAK